MLSDKIWFVQVFNSSFLRPPAANHSPEEGELQPEAAHLLHGGAHAAEVRGLHRGHLQNGNFAAGLLVIDFHKARLSLPYENQSHTNLFQPLL